LWRPAFGPIVMTMDQLPVSEILPGLYRAVLDAVARLEAHGRRREAASIREQATATYSRAWNAAAERKLRSLSVRADRIVESRRNAGSGRRPHEPKEARGRSIDLEHTIA
jgi:hypothetical protein